MFVLHALVLTFITTPLTLMFYPSEYRTRSSAAVEAGVQHGSEAAGQNPFRETIKTKFTVVVDRIEQLPTLMTLTQLLQSSSTTLSTRSPSVSESAKSNEKEVLPSAPPGLSYASTSQPLVSIDVLRLIELTDRTSAVFKSQSADTLVHSDPILAIFRTFGYLNRFTVSTALAVVGFEEFAPHIASFAQQRSSELVILPWSSGTPLVDQSSAAGSSTIPVLNPFDTLFGGQSRNGPQNASIVQTQFFRKMFAAATTNVALYIDRGLSQPLEDLGCHIFLPFFGGPDDRLALSFVIQLCMSSTITATVVRFHKADSDALTPVSTIEDAKKVTLSVCSLSSCVSHRILTKI